MVSRLLNYNVSGFEVYGTLVEHHVDLASDDDRLIDGTGAVH